MPPINFLRLVRRAIGAIATLNVILLTASYMINLSNVSDYNSISLGFQQLIVNLFIVFAVIYALSPKRQQRLSDSATLNDRNKEWSRRRRALFTGLLATMTLLYSSIALNRLASPNLPGGYNTGGFHGCDAYGSLKWACVVQFIVCATELVCVVLLVVEGVFTYREHGLREQEEREQERLQELPPIVVQYQPDLMLPARARTRGEAVPGMEMEMDRGVEEEEVEELPEYERHPKPRRGQQVVIVDMTQVEPMGQGQGEQEFGTSRLPNYDTVVEMPERIGETEALAAPAALEESSSVSTESTLDPLSAPDFINSPSEDPSAESAPSTSTAPVSLSPSSTEPEATHTSLPTSILSSLPRLPSYKP